MFHKVLTNQNKTSNHLKNAQDNSQGSGVLDYVTGWYIKAAKYIHDTKIKAAFVSTNSICQGIQVSTLWRILLEQEKIIINFAF